MAVNGEMKSIGTKLLQYNETDNTWYAVPDLRPRWWLKFQDKYTSNESIVSTGTVTDNIYYFGNAGSEKSTFRTVIPLAVNKTCTTTNGVASIASVAHGFLEGQAVTVTTTGAGFTAGTVYYVTIKTDDAFTVSLTFLSGTNTAVTPNASTTVTFYSRACIRTVDNTDNGLYSLDPYHGNHINSNYILSNPLTSGTISAFTVVFELRANNLGQTFPSTVPERTLFELYTDVNNTLRLYMTSAYKFSAQLNDVNILIDNATFTANYIPYSYFLVCKYDGTTLTYSYISNPTDPFSVSTATSGKTITYTTASTINICADHSGTTAWTKGYIVGFKFYDTCLTDDEVGILYNSAKFNHFCTVSTVYRYWDFGRWTLDDLDSTKPINQTGFGYNMIPNTATYNIQYNNVGTGILIDQTEEGIHCFKFVAASKGYLSSTRSMNADNNFYANRGFSISMWFKDVSTTNATRRWLNSSPNTTVTGTQSIGFGEYTNTTPMIYLTINEFIAYVDYGVTTWKNQWNLWTVVINGYTPGTITLYCNGIQVAIISGGVTGGTRAGFTIGGRNPVADSEYVDGFMRDVMFKQYAMSVGEIKRIYNNGKPLNV